VLPPLLSLTLIGRTRGTQTMKALKGDFLMEVKYDGDRIQIHKRGNEYRYFSRRAVDFTGKYGATSDIAGLGTHAPRIHQAFKPGVESCILDGEMMLWDREAHVFVTKGVSDVDVKGNFSADSKVRCLYASARCLGPP